MKIALVSMDQVWEDKEANKVRCRQFIERASKDRADLIVFPEMTLTGFSMDIARTAEHADSAHTLHWFRTQAVEHRIAIVMGYVQWSTDEQRALNKCALISAEGTVLGMYVKTHPFSLSGEDRVFEKGNELQTCDFGGATFGLTICYDLRFPELYQGLSKSCSVILNIANWASKRTLHWNVLLQARAIENQVFMIGVNRTGSAPDGQSYDHSSAIYSPFGNPVAPLEDDGEYGVYAIDLEETATVRAAYSVKLDRRVDWYKTIL